MISIFGLISFIVLIVSIVLLIWHSKLMKMRGNIDIALDNIHEALDVHPEDLADTVGAYNDAVNIYNSYIQSVPGNISATLVGLEKEKLMEMPDESH